MKAEHEFYRDEDIRLVAYNCVECKFENTCAVLPHNPVISKHRCEHCARLNDVHTRPSFEQEIAPHVAEAREMTKHQMRRPKSVQINAEMRAVREARERALGKRTVVDPRRLGLPGWGNATLVD